MYCDFIGIVKISVFTKLDYEVVYMYNLFVSFQTVIRLVIIW